MRGRAHSWSFSQGSEILIQSRVSGVDLAERYPPHPQPLSRVGARGADARDLFCIRPARQKCHYDLQSSVVVGTGPTTPIAGSGCCIAPLLDPARLHGSFSEPPKNPSLGSWALMLFCITASGAGAQDHKPVSTARDNGIVRLPVIDQQDIRFKRLSTAEGCLRQGCPRWYRTIRASYGLVPSTG